MIRATAPIAALVACTLVAGDVSDLSAQAAGGANETRTAPELADAGGLAQSVSLSTRLLSALGGAVLGAGIGFFASQIHVGDWDEGSGRDIDRRTWAFVGGSVGLTLGFSFPLHIGNRPRAAPAAPLPSTSGVESDAGAVVLTGAALGDDSVTLLEAMKGKVPNFRVKGYTNNCPDIMLRSYVSFADVANPHVYVDGARTGDTCALETLRTPDVERLEVYPQGYTSRPGYARHAAGLILVFTRSAVPDAGFPMPTR